MSRPKEVPTNFVDTAWMAKRIHVDKQTGCHLWIGKRSKDGYGRVLRHGTSRAAHRVAWALSGRALMPDMVLDHLCRNVACVNVAHLEQVTQRVNTSRGVGETAAYIRSWDTGVCINGHDLSEVGAVKQGKANRCGECSRSRVREYLARRRARSDSMAVVPSE